MKKKQIYNSKLIIICALVLVGALLIALFILKHNKRVANEPKGNPKQINQINYGPPTREEANAGDKQKNQVTTPTTQSSTQTNGKKNVSVIITDASQYGDSIEIRAFVQNYIKNGTCTIIIQKGSTQINKQVPAYADASSTICTNLNLSRSEISDGEWNVSVGFESTDASGTSQTRVMRVQ